MDLFILRWIDISVFFFLTLGYVIAFSISVTKFRENRFYIGDFSRFLMRLWYYCFWLNSILISLFAFIGFVLMLYR